MCPRIKKTAQRLMLLSSLLLIACQPNNNSAPTNETCLQLNAEQAGKQIVAIYRTAIADTTMLLKNQPDGKTIETQFDEMLTAWQLQLLQVGQHVAVMEDEEKKTSGTSRPSRAHEHAIQRRSQTTVYGIFTTYFPLPQHPS